MTEDEITQSVANELGADVVAALESDKEKERALGLSEALMIAGLLGQAVQIAISVWQSKKSPAERVEAIATNQQLQAMHPRLDPEKRAEVIARVLAKLDPENFGKAEPEPEQTRSLATEGSTDSNAKLDMVRGLLAERGENLESVLAEKTRDFSGGVPILIPFADQNWWIVTNELHWLPDASDGPGVVRSDIPANFVCDLASVPRYLWTILPKTGQYGYAAIHHDWLCWDQTCTRLEADDTFYAVMGKMGVGRATRSSIYWGCRIFGGSYWKGNTRSKANGERRILKRLPSNPAITWKQWQQEPGVFV